MTNLLATVVAARGWQPEPVATAALVHLCNRRAGAEALAALLAELCPGALTDGLHSTGQDIDVSSPGRPDLVAADTSGVRLVIEAKFDAELTPAQLSGAYLARLGVGSPGALVFLVPADRLRAVWLKVLIGPGRQTEPDPVDPRDIDAGLVRLTLASGHVLAAMSWEALFTRLSASMDRHREPEAQGDLEQIQGLVAWRSRTGWTPLAPDDLPQRAGRQLEALALTIKRAAVRVSASPPRRVTGEGGPGRYVSTQTGKSFWVGLWFLWWGEQGPGPAWAQITVSRTSHLAALGDALRTASIEHRPRTEHTDLLIPLHIPEGAELGTVEDEIVAQLQRVSLVLDAMAFEVVEDVGSDAQNEDVDRPQE